MPRAPTNWLARSTPSTASAATSRAACASRRCCSSTSLFDESEEPPPAICVFDPDFHEGVVGIVASRIKDRLHRPTFVFAASQAPGKEHELKGSGRSIPGFHLRDALDLVAKRHPGVLLRFGGHAMAAGCTVAEEHLDVFEQALAQVAHEWLDARHADAPAGHRRAARSRIPPARPGGHLAPRGLGPGLRAADIQRRGGDHFAEAGGRKAPAAQAARTRASRWTASGSATPSRCRRG